MSAFCNVRKCQNFSVYLIIEEKTSRPDLDLFISTKTQRIYYSLCQECYDEFYNNPAKGNIAIEGEFEKT